LIAMRIGERNHAHGITVPECGRARQRQAIVPVQGKLVGQDKVDDAAAQADEDRAIAGGAPHFTWAVGSLEFDAALAEVPHSFGPNARPEVAKLLGRAVRPGIHDSMNAYSQPPLCPGADRRCHPEESPPRHSHPPEHRHSIAARCYEIAAASTIDIVSRTQSSEALPPKRHELYETAVREFGHALDRLAAGYEADPEKRHDLRQDIHFQLLRSFEVFDGRCSLKTWTFRVAHNTAVSYVIRERRENAGFVSLEEIEQTAPSEDREPDIDQQRALQQLSHFIRQLKPLDRQIMISYLEEMDAATIAEVTGLSPANVRMKIHRIKSILSSRFLKEKRYV
jgi:RNA polymerase sigma-70 factor (ECF subfamily)